MWSIKKSFDLFVFKMNEMLIIESTNKIRVHNCEDFEKSKNMKNEKQFKLLTSHV